MRSALLSSKDFEFYNFTARAIKAVDEKAGKKGYRTVLLSVVTTLLYIGN